MWLLKGMIWMKRLPYQKNTFSMYFSMYFRITKVTGKEGKWEKTERAGDGDGQTDRHSRPVQIIHTVDTVHSFVVSSIEWQVILYTFIKL